MSAGLAAAASRRTTLSAQGKSIVPLGSSKDRPRPRTRALIKMANGIDIVALAVSEEAPTILHVSVKLDRSARNGSLAPKVTLRGALAVRCTQNQRRTWLEKES
jgi:hypothetical protein